MYTAQYKTKRKVTQKPIQIQINEIKNFFTHKKGGKDTNSNSSSSSYRVTVPKTSQEDRWLLYHTKHDAQLLIGSAILCLNRSKDVQGNKCTWDHQGNEMA